MEVSEEDVRSAFAREPWPHQLRGVLDLFREAQTSSTICYAALTGSGKTFVQAAILRMLARAGKRAIVYNARRPLINQLSRSLDEANIHHGARAASMKEMQNLDAAMQIGSLQTDFARVLNQKVWDIHDCDYVLIDECHMPEAKASRAQILIQKYLERGATVVGFTGTPLEISHIYKSLVVAGTKKEMLACKAHCIARYFCIHQLDVSRVKPTKTGEYNENDLIRECWNPAIVGYAYEDWKKLNPDGKPTMASAPGVAESVWVAEQWRAKGHRVAHIDAKEVIVNGERYANDTEGTVREDVLKEARQGKFELITNCEVLSAGIDIPCIAHVILLRPFGKLSNYLQVVGRGIRYHPSKDHLIVQDHVGAAHTHGSVNEEIDWHSLFEMSETDIREDREKLITEEKKEEPITCPECGLMRASGPKCPGCGHESNKRIRRIVELDGTLSEMEGKFFSPPTAKPPVPIEQKQWDSLYYPAKNSKSSQASNFNQLIARYKRQYKANPPSWLKRIPVDPADFGRKVRDVTELT